MLMIAKVHRKKAETALVKEDTKKTGGSEADESSENKLKLEKKRLKLEKKKRRSNKLNQTPPPFIHLSPAGSSYNRMKYSSCPVDFCPCHDYHHRYCS